MKLHPQWCKARGVSNSSSRRRCERRPNLGPPFHVLLDDAAADVLRRVKGSSSLPLLLHRLLLPPNPIMICIKTSRMQKCHNRNHIFLDTIFLMDDDDDGEKEEEGTVRFLWLFDLYCYTLHLVLCSALQ